MPNTIPRNERAISIGLTYSEYNLLLNAAKFMGLSPSSFARVACVKMAREEVEKNMNYQTKVTEYKEKQKEFIKNNPEELNRKEKEPPKRNSSTLFKSKTELDDVKSNILKEVSVHG